MSLRWLVGACLLLSPACVTPAPSAYEWGGYQDSVYLLATDPGGVDIGGQIIQLNETVEKSRMEGKPLPPGFHAHLGYLHLLVGDRDTAQAALESEKELYPESAVFIDGLLARMGDR